MDNVIDYLMLKLSVEVPDLGNALIAAESLLEQGRYEEVEERLIASSNNSRYFGIPGFFLVHFFLGQAILREEMDKKRPEEQKLEKAIDYFSQSIVQSPEFIDAYCLRGLALIAKARSHSVGKITLQNAQEDFERVLKEGNEAQEAYATERLEFISSVLRENA